MIRSATGTNAFAGKLAMIKLTVMQTKIPNVTLVSIKCLQLPLNRPIPQTNLMMNPTKWKGFFVLHK